MSTGDSLQEVFEGIKLKDVMNTDVTTVFEDDEFSCVQEIFVKKRVNHIPVVNHEKEVVGLVSQKYLYKAQSPRKVMQEEMDYDPDIIADGDSFYDRDTLDSFILRNVMKKNPITLTPEDSLYSAVINMAKYNLGCIPIVNDKKKIKGVVDTRDLVNCLATLISK